MINHLPVSLSLTLSLSFSFSIYLSLSISFSILPISQSCISHSLTLSLSFLFSIPHYLYQLLSSLLSLSLSLSLSRFIPLPPLSNSLELHSSFSSISLKFTSLDFTPFPSLYIYLLPSINISLSSPFSFPLLANCNLIMAQWFIANTRPFFLHPSYNECIVNSFYKKVKYLYIYIFMHIYISISIHIYIYVYVNITESQKLKLHFKKCTNSDKSKWSFRYLHCARNSWYGLSNKRYWS